MLDHWNQFCKELDRHQDRTLIATTTIIVKYTQFIIWKRVRLKKLAVCQRETRSDSDSLLQQVKIEKLKNVNIHDWFINYSCL